MAVSIIPPKFYGFDPSTGKALPFGKVYSYEPGTSTPKATYTGEDGLTPNTNPVVLNAAGYADVYLEGSYKIVLTDASDVEIWSKDPVSDPGDLSSVAFNTTTETIVLADGQTEVTFINPVLKASFFISGDLADNGRLANTQDYAVNTILNKVVLAQSYPAGTRITLTYNEAGTSTPDDDVVFETVATLKASSTIVGLLVKTKGYTTAGDGGGATYLIVPSQAADGYGDHVLANGNVAVLLAEYGAVTSLQYGLFPSPTGTPVDREAGLTAFFNSVHTELVVLGDSSGDNILTSKTIQTGTGKTIRWGQVALQSIVQVDLGAVISFGADSIVYSPWVDGGGPALIIGSSGQNGYGATGKVVVYNPRADNCARGISAPFDGGKGFQSEGDSTDLTIYNMGATNCHMAVSSRKDGALGTGNHLKVFGLKAKNCNHISFSGQANVNTLDPEVYSVLITGIEGEDIGALDALQDAAAGAFIHSRSANVTITDGHVAGATKLEGVVRGRARNSTIKGITVSSACDAVVNIDPVPVIAIDTSLSEGLDYDISVQTAGGVDRLVLSDLTDATHANRIIDDSRMRFLLKSDVVTSLVTPALRNGDCRMDVQLASKVYSANVSTYNSLYANMAAVPSNSALDYREGLWSPTFEGSGGSIGSTAYTEQSGSYVRIGQMVFLNGVITVSNLGSWTGSVRIGGVPFNSGLGGYENFGSIELRSVALAEKYAITEIGRSAANKITIRLVDNGVGASNLAVTSVSAGDSFLFSIAYKLA